MNWIKWPNWAKYLYFDADNEAIFSEQKANGHQFGVWNIEGRYEMAIQNEDFEVSLYSKYPNMSYYAHPDY